MEDRYKKIIVITLTVLTITVGLAASYMIFLSMAPCPSEVNLVCGTDKITYANECAANKEDVDVASKGNCYIKSSVIESYKPGKSILVDGKNACTDIFQPTCGIDGVTYSNPCVTLSNSIKIAYIGECSSSKSTIMGTSCKSNSNFVCTYPGLTYQNKCLADFYHAEIISMNACPDCTEQKPVCGVDGVTYANECAAKVHLISVAHDGYCAKK